MTEPEVAGSDPTLIQTRAVRDGDDWVVNGHKWFISGARGAQVRDPDRAHRGRPRDPAGRRTRAFIVDLPSQGWKVVRDVDTMAGSHNHCEIRIANLRVPNENMLGGRGQGHLLGQARLGPARLAHCMRWIGQAEMALDMMVDRALKRFAHGSLLAEKQGIQWMIADSTMELYQCKLMVLHAAYKIDRGEDFRSEVSMAKHFVANALEPHHRPRDPGARRARLLDATRRSRTWRSRRAGRASPTAPTRCTSGASRSARSRPTSATARRARRRGTCLSRLPRRPVICSRPALLRRRALRATRRSPAPPCRRGAPNAPDAATKAARQRHRPDLSAEVSSFLPPAPAITQASGP